MFPTKDKLGLVLNPIPLDCTSVKFIVSHHLQKSLGDTYCFVFPIKTIEFITDSLFWFEYSTCEVMML